MAKRFQLSNLLIGAVVIGFGTSTPELSASISAALKGAPDIALGNVIGSNTANVFLIAGMAGLLCPLKIPYANVHRDVVMMIVSSVMLVVMMWFETLDMITGVIFLLTLAGYIIWSFQSSDDDVGNEVSTAKTYSTGMAFVLLAVGIATLTGGAAFLVDGVIGVARRFGISEAIIGLTVVAVGSSLPELATAIISSIQKQSEMVLGNIIGSSIFNVLAILGVTALIQPIPVSPQMMSFDVWVMIAATLLLTLLIVMGIKIGRRIGSLMVIGYLSYVIWLYL
ncbi:MAG: sodium:calcium antiporter [Alphaproteobacteria bacterium]|nr:sodium:calcium antiporter [Alphaproteobacteria bacterium]